MRKKRILLAVLRIFGVLAACALLLAVLVWVPLKTHRPVSAELDLTSSSLSETDDPPHGSATEKTDGEDLVSAEEPPEGMRSDEEKAPAAPSPIPEEPIVFSFPDPSQPLEDPQLQALLDAFVDRHPGVWDIYVYDLSGGCFAAANTSEGRPMVSASLIKLFIMGSFYQALTDGTLEEYQYWNCYPSVRDMIINSNNYCANWLIVSPLGRSSESVGFEYVTAFAESIGCTDTRLERQMLADNSEHENYTSAEDCAKFLTLIYRCKLISPEYSNEMLDILKAQNINNRIPAGLPEGTVCAHKTGDLSNLSCGDVGLIFSPGADYILCVINNFSENDAETADQIVELSAEVYSYFNPPAPEVTEEPETDVQQG